MMQYLLKTTLAILLCAVVYGASAQTATPGPSDPSTTPPANAAAVAQVLCFGAPISLKAPTDPTYKKYQWYKLDSGGNKHLVQDGTSNTYTEASAGAGYYSYQVVISNANDCSSDISDPYKVFVLPDLTPTITAANNVTTVCEKGQSTTTLTASADPNYTYTYQWTRNGTDIPGATNNTYVVTEQSAGNVTYGVKMSYTLNNGCSKTATQTIVVAPVPVKPAIVAGP